MEKREHTGFWNRAYVLDLVCIVCTVVPMTYVMPLLPIYIQHTLGGSGTASGIVVAVFNLAALLCSPFLAYLTDHRRKKVIIAAGFLLLVVNCSFYQYAGSVTALLVIRVVHGIGYGLSATAAGALPSDVQPPELRHRGNGFYGTVLSAGIAFGPVLGLVANNLWGMKTAFALLPIICVIGLGAALLIPKELELAYAHTSTDSRFTMAHTVSKAAVPTAAVLGIIYFAYIAISAFFAVYTRQLGYSNIVIGYYLIYMLAMLLTRLTVEQVGKRRKLNAFPLTILGIVLTAAGFAVLGFMTSVSAFLCSAAIYGIGFGIMQPLLFSAILSSAKPAERGAANSTILNFQYIGMTLGSVIWGSVANTAGYAAVYRCCIIVSVLAAGAFVVVVRKR